MAQFIRVVSKVSLPGKSHLRKPSVRSLFGGSKKSELQEAVRPQVQNELIRLEPVELASGFYRKDVLIRLGNDSDPYSVKSFRRGVGTKECPNMIPSAFESRMVGCICEEDSATIVWMWLHKGVPKKCQCGHWFQLFYEAPFYVKDETLLSDQ